MFSSLLQHCVLCSVSFLFIFQGAALAVEEQTPQQVLADAIKTDIQQKDIEAANAKTDQLWTQYHSSEGIVELASGIMHKYWAAGDRDQFFALGERIVTDFPKHSLAPGVLTSQILKHIEARDMASANQKLQTLCKQYHPPMKAEAFAEYLDPGKPYYENIVECLIPLRDAYLKAGEYAVYKAFCDDILADFPTHPLAPEILTTQIIADIKQKDMTAAEAKLKTLWEKYGSAERLYQSLRDTRAACWRAGEMSVHQAVCERFVSEFPDDPLAVRMRGYEIEGCLKLKDMAQAETKTEELFTKHSQPAESFIEAARAIIGIYSRMNDSGKVIELCNRVMEKYPDHKLSLPVYTKLIAANLDLNAEAQADEATGRVIQHYSGQPDFGKVLNGIADAYRKSKHHSKSIELFQNALTRAGDDQNILVDAYAGMSKAAVWLEGGQKADSDPNTLVTVNLSIDIPNVDEIVEKLMADYPEHKKLGYHVFQIAEEYYFRAEAAQQKANHQQAEADFQRAITLWQNNINRINDSYHQAMATYFSAVACQYLGRDQEAMAYYQKVVSQHPKYKKAWYAQYMIAKHLEKQARLNQASSDVVKNAYQVILDEFPDSPAAQIAGKKINTL